MVLNTLTVAAAVTPTVIETYFSHYFNKRNLQGKPTAYIGYHEGLQLVRQFLAYAADHTVEEVQAFTQQWVPVPAWVKADDVTVPIDFLTKAADLLQAQLGAEGIERVGGKTWWQWRGENTEFKAEWIEMRKDYSERKAAQDPKGQRIILYIHGGAYYFGSVDEHRYQMQRHARKLKARVFAPRYRLSPQFPFPCGLHDAIAAYLYLLEDHDPSTILVAGDSAGGGMAVSLLVTLRDQGIPLPAGGILLSPWVDLTHSFPSLLGDGKLDYIPSHGFSHKPSVAWPPPNADDLEAIKKGSIEMIASSRKSKNATVKDTKEEGENRARGFSIEKQVDGETPGPLDSNTKEADGEAPEPLNSNAKAAGSSFALPPPNLTVTIDGKSVTIKDQIQLYAANHLLNHPLVSPVLQPTLGGLPPLLIQVGGGELLHDEQVYLAHKAAAPMSYLPDLSHLTPEEQEHVKEAADKYPPTDVKLEVWDDLCHVAHTLSFTRPAKLMYRGVAQFGAWALARAQKKPIDILDDDDVSQIGDTPEASPERPAASSSAEPLQHSASTSLDGKLDIIGRAGDSIPQFEHHMIRQRVDRQGRTRAMEPPEEIPLLHIPPSEIGIIKEGPVRKWMTVQERWAKKFEKEKRAVQSRRIEEMAAGYEGFDGEIPPPTALAGRRLKDKDLPRMKKVKGWGLAMWSGWGSKHDQATIRRETRADSTGEDIVAPDGAADSKTRPRSVSTSSKKKDRRLTVSRPRSRRRTVTDEGQTETWHPASTEGMLSDQLPTTSSPPPFLSLPVSSSYPETGSIAATISTRAPDPDTAFSSPIPSPRLSTSDAQQPLIVMSEHADGSPTIIPPSNNTSTRPTCEGIAYPFKLQVGNHKPNPSTTTLMSFQSSMREKEADGTGVETKTNGTGNSVLKEDGPKEAAEEEKDRETHEAAHGEETEKKDARPAPERFVTAAEF
ncbi:acetyl-hydrolase [Phyllosticta capitalensis]|uniref:Acetyl-hydrolase n=1 Tax=Phyllosticta capitalensis TaxID=121624 RepID=A0ABR1YME4_9PEZI